MWRRRLVRWEVKISISHWYQHCTVFSARPRHLLVCIFAVSKNNCPPHFYSSIPRKWNYCLWMPMGHMYSMVASLLSLVHHSTVPVWYIDRTLHRKDMIGFVPVSFVAFIKIDYVPVATLSPLSPRRIYQVCVHIVAFHRPVMLWLPLFDDSTIGPRPPAPFRSSHWPVAWIWRRLSAHRKHLRQWNE